MLGASGRKRLPLILVVHQLSEPDGHRRVRDPDQLAGDKILNRRGEIDAPAGQPDRAVTMRLRAENLNIIAHPLIIALIRQPYRPTTISHPRTLSACPRASFPNTGVAEVFSFGL